MPPVPDPAPLTASLPAPLLAATAPYWTDEEMMVQLATTLKVPRDSLADYWAAVVSASHSGATADVRGRLMRRGFTQAQADAFDRFAEFERDITLGMALLRGGVYEEFKETAKLLLDRRKELSSVLVFINGVWATPAEAPGNIGAGSAVGSGTGSIFTWPDPDDPHLNTPTYW